MGWIQSGDNEVCDGPYLRADRQEQTLAALGRRAWARLGCRHAIIRPDGLVEDSMDDDLEPTEQFAKFASDWGGFSSTESHAAATDAVRGSLACNQRGCPRYPR